MRWLYNITAKVFCQYRKEKKMKDYYLGLDIGTDSVGWAVTDNEYKIPKFKGNSMWGIRLFEESQPADERRSYRSSRRRVMRKRERLELLEILFDEEISKKDISFYQRLKDSSLYAEDKGVEGKYCIFNDEDFTDADFHKKYPTVYHLRKELIESKEPHDARLVFLALHHIIKYRGHFLFDSLSADSVNDFNAVYNDLSLYLLNNYEITLNCSDLDEFSQLLKNKKIGKRQKNEQIIKLFGLDKKEQAAYILSLLSGSSVKLSDVFNDETLKDAEKKNISLSGNFDDTAAEYESILGERFELIEMLKAVYDWAILADILDGEQYISFAKVKVYDKHKSDLKQLKEYVKTYLPDKYNEIFKLSKKGLNNYTAYSAHVKKNSKTGVLNEHCTQEDFCAYLKKTLGVCTDDSYLNMFDEIETGSFIPKQTGKENGVIPMQIHRAELVKILDNAKEYLPFLSEADNEGKIVYDKIISLFDYKIPYYVGPLNNHTGKYWLVRNNQKIYPWNIREVVDFDKSAESFIENLTSKCTYLPQYDVIPKNSILYSKFTVLNELNNLKINGEKIDVSLKQDIYNDLFMKHYKVTRKALLSYLKSTQGLDVDSVTGIDGDFKSSLKPILDLQSYNLTTEEKEEIIKSITIFGDDKKLLLKRLEKNYSGKLSKDEIKKISKLKYTGWSRLSKEFLTQVECTDKNTGEYVNIITAMWQTNDNLMQILYSNNYSCDGSEDKTFVDKIAEMNSFDSSKSLSKMVDELYISPKVKRPVYQSLLIAKEIEKIQSCPPKKIFVEVARGADNSGRKSSRKQRLVDLYKSCGKEYDDLYKSLCDKSDDELRKDKLYLYYTQFGECMYTGEKIDLDDLLGPNSKWDIDHIYPQSKIKDDSLDNRVLVKKVVNNKKTNEYPIDSKIQESRKPFWRFLLQKELISKEKYNRLVRTLPLSDDELSAFISRQLVETRQSTKAVAGILSQLYPDTEIVYVKAGLVSDFRQQYDLLKCRDINDFHHAKDAYLNIVVGNVYNVKFTHNRAAFVKGLQMTGPHGFSLNRMFNFNTPGAWVADNNKSLMIVKNTMKKNNIRYTRYSYEQHGGLFDRQLLKKGNGQVSIKATGPISDISKYGGYNKALSKYFSLVKYFDKKGKTIIQLVPINAYKEKDYLANPNAFVSDILGCDAEVIKEKIKYNSCLSFDGFRMHISASSGGGSQIAYKPAMQLILNTDEENYFRNISKYLERYSYRDINEYDHITADENISLFNSLIEKMTSTIFSVKFADFGNKLADKTEKFENISVEKQSFVLAEIVKILHCNAMSGDLSNIGLAKHAGICATNSKLSEIKDISSVKLINQSITGLFENEIDLLK